MAEAAPLTRPRAFALGGSAQAAPGDPSSPGCAGARGHEAAAAGSSALQSNTRCELPGDRPQCLRVRPSQPCPAGQAWSAAGGAAGDLLHRAPTCGGDPHMLRHSFASRLRGNCADLQIIQEALGHASIVTTTMYAHMATPKRLAELTKFLVIGERDMATILVTVLCVLATASTLYAECAWVLWTQALNPQTGRVRGAWNPAAGFKDREECVRSQEQLQSSSKSNAVTVACLPDTVDPRRPKETK